MSEIENLEILISVIDQYTIELDQLLFKLGEVDLAAEAVDNITIDVDVRGQQQLNALMAQMGALQAARGGSIGAGTGRGLDMDRLMAGMEVLSQDIKGLDLGDASRAASNFTKSIDDTEGSMSLFDLRMSDMHNALAKLVPFILTLIGALPAIIGGLVALGAAAISAAGALAALGGFGALGFAMAQEGDLMEGFAEILEQVREDFMDAFRPLAEDLAPLFEDALDGLGQLFENIARRGDVLMDLRDDARDFGQFMLDFIPGALAAMGKMTEAFSGVFAILADFISEMDLLQGLTEFFEKAFPALVRFGAVLVDVIPPILRMSIGFLEVVSAVARFLEMVGRAIDTLFFFSDEALGALIGSILTAVTAIAIWNSELGILIANSFGKLLTIIPTTIAQLRSYAGSALTAAGATNILTKAVQALKIATGVGIVLAVASAAFEMASGFLTASTKIDEATKSLKNFDRTASGFDSDDAFGVGAPTLRSGRVGASSSDVTFVFQGSADKDEVDKAGKNMNYRLERPGRAL